MTPLPQPAWPADRFGTAHTGNTTAPLFGGGKGRPEDHLCACGCKLSHNHSVSRIIGDHENRVVLWYRTMQCRNKHTGHTRGSV